MSAFGVRVIAYDPYIADTGGAIAFVDLDTVLRESDFISIHCFSQRIDQAFAWRTGIPKNAEEAIYDQCRSRTQSLKRRN